MKNASLAALALGLAAGALPGGNVVVGTPEAVAKTQAQVKAGQQATPNPVPLRYPTLGTNAVAPANWLRTRHTRRRRYPAPGWSVAEDRRRAKKARNVKRNRRAQRGGK